MSRYLFVPLKFKLHFNIDFKFRVITQKSTFSLTWKSDCKILIETLARRFFCVGKRLVHMAWFESQRLYTSFNSALVVDYGMYFLVV